MRHGRNPWPDTATENRRCRTSSTPAPSVLAGIKQALQPHAPFRRDERADLDRIVRASQLRYFAPGEVDPRAGRAGPAHCYVIRQGTVRGERPGATGDAAALWELVAGEMFPLGALLARRGVTSVYRATQDTFCLAFPVAVFDALIDASPVFQDFCTRRLAHLLDLSRASLQAEYAATVDRAARPRHAASTTLVRQAPIAVRARRRRSATRCATMEERRIGSMPVVDGDARPLGIFTRQDVIGRVVLPQRPLTTPIGGRDERARDHAPGARDGRRRRAADGATRHPARGRWSTPTAASRASCRSATSSACSGCRCASSPRRSGAPPDVAGAGPVRGRRPRAVATRWSRRAWRRASSRG